MNTRSDADDMRLTLTKWSLTADYYAKVCPALARNQIMLLNKVKEKFQDDSGAGNKLTFCPSCGQVFRPDNHTLNIKPRFRPTAKVKRLARSRSLKKGSMKEHIVKLYEQGYNRMQITCKGCNKTHKETLYSRRDRDKIRPVLGTPQENRSLTLTKSQKKKQKAKKRRQQTEEQLQSTPLLLAKEAEKQRSSKRKAPREQRQPTSTPTPTPDLSQIPSPNLNTRTSTPTGVPKASGLNKKRAFNTLHTLLSEAEKQKKTKPESSLAQFLGSL